MDDAGLSTTMMAAHLVERSVISKPSATSSGAMFATKPHDRHHWSRFHYICVRLRSFLIEAMMRVTRLLIGWTTLAGLMLVPTGEAWACQCEPTGPPCQNAFQVDAVFAATVRSIAALPEDGPPLRPGEARIPGAVRVEFGDVVAVRGTSTPIVSVVTAGSGPACGYEFKPGQRYLVYANRTKDGKGLVTGICSRTRLLQDADEDLRFLSTLSAPRNPGARLYGTISLSERDPTTDQGREPRWRKVPVPEVLVTVRGPKNTSDTWTDAQGRYALTLPPGTYEITASPPPGYSTRYLQRTVELKDAQGCLVADFNVWLDVSINGVVRLSSGEAAGGVDVELMAAEDVSKSGYIQTRRASTDVAGRFEFTEVAPGRYVVGVDLTKGPSSKEVIFPRTFYPGTPDAALATILQLDSAQRRELEPLVLPPARRAYRLTGTVVFEDGSAASGESVVLRDGSAMGAQVGGGRTGVDGRFSIVVHEGLSYVASAFYWDGSQRRHLTGSVGPFLVSGDTGPVKIVLSEGTYRERK